MSYSWFKKGTCTVTNGSTRVDFQNADITTAPNKPVVGDAFTIDFVTLYEVAFIGSDSTGEYITLDRPFDQNTRASGRYVLIRLASSTQNAALVAKASAAINQKQISLDNMNEWYTTTNDTVAFDDFEGATVDVVSYHKLSKDIVAVSGSIPNFDTVAGSITEINAVAGALPDITATANSLSDIQAVNSHIDDIRNVNANIANIDTVATNITAINTVNSNLDVIKAVNSNQAAIDKVNNNEANINAVSNNMPSVSSVSASITAVNNVNNNMADILNVNTNMAAILGVTAQVAHVDQQAIKVDAQVVAAQGFANESQASAGVSLGHANDASGFADKANLWANAPKDTIVDNGKYSAYHWAEFAMYHANLTFISGGTFDPTGANEYPDVTGIARDTIWIITLPEGQTAYTFKAGPLKDKVAGNGYQLFYDTPSNTWELIVISATGIISVNNKTGASITLTAQDVNALSISGGVLTGMLTVPSLKTDLIKDANANNIFEVAADKTIISKADLPTVIKSKTALLKVAGMDGVEHDVYSSNNKPSANDIGALPDTYKPSWSDITGEKPFDDKWITHVVNADATINDARAIILVDCSSSAIAIALGDNVEEFVIKDKSGHSEDNPITYTVPAGKTIEGGDSMFIANPMGWARYELKDSNFNTIGGA